MPRKSPITAFVELIVHPVNIYTIKIQSMTKMINKIIYLCKYSNYNLTLEKIFPNTKVSIMTELEAQKFQYIC